MKIYCMQSIPGAGKTTWINEKLFELYSHIPDSSYRQFIMDKVQICSADHYFERDGKYEWKAELLGQAHKICFDKYLNTIKNPCIEYVFIDNTNTRLSDIRHYYEPANELGHEFEIVRLWCSPQTAFKRNKHGVPLISIQRMFDQIKNCKLDNTWHTTVIDTEDYNNIAG